MQFTIGPWTYQIRVGAGPIRDRQGRELDAMNARSAREIWINGQLKAEGRLDALVHQLSLAWDDHFGAPANARARIRRQASFTIDFLSQFTAQGGVEALVELPPARPGPMIGDFLATCPRCGRPVSEDNGGRGTIRPRNGALRVDRYAQCEQCQTRFWWTESMTWRGDHGGELIAGPLMPCDPADADNLDPPAGNVDAETT